MSANRTSVWKVMTIRISRVLPLSNFEHLDILCPQIGHPSEILWPFEFLESFCCSLSSVSIYYVPESDICVKSYDHSNFSTASVVQFRASRWVISANRTTCEKVCLFEFLECFRCSISSVSIFYVLESDIRVKSYDHSNLSRASVVQFRASRWVMSANWTSEWKVMTIRISQVLPLFNFERLDILCPRIGHPVKSYDNSNFSSASVVQFRASRYFMSSNQTSEWNVMIIRIIEDFRCSILRV